MGQSTHNRRPWALRRRLGWSLALVSILGTAVFSALSFEASRRTTLASIDDTLCAAAEGVRGIVPPLIVSEAEAAPRSEPLYTETYRATHAALERYCGAMKLNYLYAIAVRPDGTAIELVGNLSPEQRAQNLDPLTGLLGKRYDPSPGMLAAARTHRCAIDIAQDGYGYFRSCLVPVAFPSGTVAIFGADMEISDVNRRLYQDLLTNIGIGLAVLFVTLIVIRRISSGIARDVRVVVGETEAVARLDIKAGEQRLHSPILEIDQLFGALFDMKNGLNAFSKYVPTSVIKRVLASGKAEIGGERRELSLLMTDVTGFTTISEKLAPERVMTVMSEYFGTVVAPILELQGTLDKYVGDAIFAYWNAPAAQPNHAALACAAALQSRAASQALAARWSAAGEFPWHTRFGLHAGETVFGNVGAPDRMDFTVIGSSVNLASRIEGLNKFYGTTILASARLRELAGDGFVFRAIDRVMPKGAVYDFEIYELMGAREHVTLDLAPWDAAYASYKGQRFSEAAEAFAQWAAAHAGDNVAAQFAARCRALAAAPPETWDGIQRFESK